MTTALQTGAPDLVSVLSAAATSKDCDPAKMKAMLDVIMEMERERARQEFSRALVAAQSEMDAVTTNAHNSQTRSNYATYRQLDRALRPVYSKHGFSVSFSCGQSEKPDVVPVIGSLYHVAGYTKEYRIDMPADGKGAKGGDVMTKTHAVGSATQYGMRYLLKMMFNVSFGDKDDDDGNAAGGRHEPASQVAIDDVRTMLRDAKRDEKAACGWLKVARLEDASKDQIARLADTLARGAR